MSEVLYLPISANPMGFNHFAAAEWLLRQNPAWRTVAFVVSNGRHPDPTKPDAEVEARPRLAMCEAACAAVADPAQSYMAAAAESNGESLRITPDRLELSTVEFPYERSVPTAETVRALHEGLAAGERLDWFAGSDLVRRMADPRIFSDADLALLAERCHYHILEREGDPVQDAVGRLEQVRAIRLTHTAYPFSAVPPWLSYFLPLSSTAIRHAVEAGDPVSGMLPAPAAAQVALQAPYREGRVGAALVTPAGEALGTRSVLALALEKRHIRVEAQAAALAELLVQRRDGGQAHSLAVLETTCGGLITAALAGRSGASRYFRQSRFAYDVHAKTSLLGGDVPGGSSVSEEAVRALAAAMRDQARVDYALAESGMAGPPDALRRSRKYGHCVLALAAPLGTVSEEVRLNPFLTRREHQLGFAEAALALALRVVASE